VTGGARGIGAGIARVLASHGARVAVLDLDGAEAEKTAAALASPGMAVTCDAAVEGDTAKAVRSVVDSFGGLDIVVNNAGAGRGSTDPSVARATPGGLGSETMSAAQWDVYLSQNLRTTFVMTAAALVKRQPPSMDGAVDAMYGWLARHPHLDKDGLLIDTGSGLSYKTQISPHELVSIIRSAGGYLPDTDPGIARAWLRSLSVGGTDGTLQHRFMTPDLRGRVRGKTGTLSTAIALSGILDVDPQRPLAFALVTNTDSPLSKGFVRKAHEAVISEICKYLAKTATPRFGTPPVEIPMPAEPQPAPPPITPVEDVEEPQPDKALDAEASGTPLAP